MNNIEQYSLEDNFFYKIEIFNTLHHLQDVMKIVLEYWGEEARKKFI